MAETSIEWVKNPDGTQGRTWNPIRGCTRVSPGCGGPGPHGGCYAEGIAGRFSGPGQPFEGIAEMRGGKGRWTGKLAFVEAKLTEPLRVRKPTTWFVNSMSDLFHEAVPDEWIDRVFAVMALCPQHTFQVLTKRSARMRAWFARERACSAPAECLAELYSAHLEIATKWPFTAERAIDVGRRGWPLPNVWLGVSTEDQRRADERIPDLLATSAAVRFVSAEPLLGPLDLSGFMWPVCGWWKGPYRSYAEARAAGAECGLKRQALVWAGSTFLDWVIVGGESGSNARAMHPSWARSIRDQCAAASVAFLFKQHGAFRPVAPIHEHDDRCAGAWLTADERHCVMVCEDGRIWPDGQDAPPAGAWMMQRVGKKAAGRLLDGRTWDQMPEVPHA